MKYFIDDGNLFEMDVFRDDYAEDPRQWFDHVSHMCVFWNDYRLGDYTETEGMSPVKYLDDLVSERLPDADTEDKSPLELLQILYSDKNIVVLPLYVYEHGMLTISTSDIVNPYGHWDSGLAGFIWMDHESFSTYYGDSEAWRDFAISYMQEEVEEYDMYLQGEVYAVQTCPYDIDSHEFDEAGGEIIGGYYTRKYGDDLYREIAADITSSDLYDDLESAIASYKKDLVKHGRLFESLQIA